LTGPTAGVAWAGNSTARAIPTLYAQQFGGILYAKTRRLRTVIFGLLFALMGVAFLFIFGQRIDLVCRRQERQAVTCEKAQSFLGIIPWKKERFTGITGAYVDENCSDSCKYRVVFTTARGVVPLTGAYTSGYNAKAQMVSQIDGFFTYDESRLVLQDGPSVVGVAAPGLFILVGVLISVSGIARKVRIWYATLHSLNGVSQTRPRRILDKAQDLL
jgi:hypothetical protein